MNILNQLTAFALAVAAWGNAAPPALAKPAGEKAIPTALPISAHAAPNAQVLSTEDRPLYGQKNTFPYTYSLAEDGRPGPQNRLHLEWSHSSLLIPPSSVTLAIDGQPVRSVSLSKKTASGRIDVPLQKAHLRKGSHKLTIQFSGVMKEGVCVNQNTPGNWMTIKPTSYLSLAAARESAELGAFPKPFTDTSGRPTVVVLPEEPSADELKAGLLVKKSLQLKATNARNVLVKREGQLQRLDGNAVFVGAASSWKGEVGSLLKRAPGAQGKPNSLSLKRAKLTNGGRSVEALFVSAVTPAALADKIDIALDDSLQEQLAGTSMDVERLPATPQAESSEITLARMGAQNLFLTGLQPASAHYFYPIPAFQQNSALTLKLKFKASPLLAAGKSELRSGAELIAWVNGVPHAISLAQLPAEDGLWIERDIRVDSAVAKGYSFLDTAFEVTGLKEKAVCIETDEQKWVFISKDSRWSLPPVSAQPDPHTFLNWTSAFGNEQQGTIVLPNRVDDRTLAEVDAILTALPALSSKDIRFAKEGELSEAEMKKRSLLFIGGPRQHPALDGVKGQLSVMNEDGDLDLASRGFLPETAKQVIWTQPSPWNEERTLVVFDRLTEETAGTDLSLLDVLSAPDEPFSVAVKSKNGKVFTDSQSVKEDRQKAAPTAKAEKEKPTAWLYAAGFALLLAAVAALLIRQRKKRI